MKKILFFVFLYFYVHASFADEVMTYPGKLPTVWVWKVEGARLLYLAGEIHSFFDVEEASLNYDFSYALYRSASAIYTEADVLTSNGNADLSTIVGPALWKKVDGVLWDMLSKTKISMEKREYFHKSELSELNAQNPFVAYSNLSKLAHISYISSKKIKTFSAVGSYSKLLKLDGVYGVKKIKYLENSTVIDDVWSENCEDEKITQDLIKSALIFFDFDNFFNSNKKITYKMHFLKTKNQ